MQLSFGRAASLRSFIFLGGLVSSVNALALTIQHDFEIPLATTNWSQTVELDRFDASLGTLTSVEFYIGGTLVSDTSLANLSRSSSNRFTGASKGTFSAKELGTGTEFYNQTVETFSTDVTFATNPTGAPLFNGVNGQRYLGKTNTGSFNYSSTDANVLSYVTGGNKLQFEISAKDVSSWTSTSGNAFIGVTTKASATGWIKYNYTPEVVPEPATMAALGLGAFAALRRRRSAK